jgi:hypothetical protein
VLAALWFWVSFQDLKGIGRTFLFGDPFQGYYGPVVIIGGILLIVAAAVLVPRLGTVFLKSSLKGLLLGSVVSALVFGAALAIGQHTARKLQAELRAEMQSRTGIQVDVAAEMPSRKEGAGPGSSSDMQDIKQRIEYIDSRKGETVHHLLFAKRPGRAPTRVQDGGWTEGSIWTVMPEGTEVAYYLGFDAANRPVEYEEKRRDREGIEVQYDYVFDPQGRTIYLGVGTVLKQGCVGYQERKSYFEGAYQIHEERAFYPGKWNEDFDFPEGERNDAADCTPPGLAHSMIWNFAESELARSRAIP